MPVSLSKLKSLAEEIVEDLARRPHEAREVLTASMVDYHGFGKTPLSTADLTQFPSATGLDPDDVQVDVVRVTVDLTGEVHYHAKANAYVVCLGQQHGFPDPVNAMTFIAAAWRPLVAGERLTIPAGDAHGFTVDRGGVLYFLSVQSPPISREGEEDDYHHVEVPGHGRVRDGAASESL